MVLEAGYPLIMGLQKSSCFGFDLPPGRILVSIWDFVEAKRAKDCQSVFVFFGLGWKNEVNID